MMSNNTRSSSKREAEAELNLPPGFRFHPTDEELLLHYLCRKVTSQCLPAPISVFLVAELALFGTKEWYFFSPRDRKYPNGLRPNRAAGHGYWKATGADKPVNPTLLLGIKKALVFYSGKAPSGVKTDWIMHEYRLAQPNRPSNDKTSLRLDGWVLCRIYNKKNNWEKIENLTGHHHPRRPHRNINDREPMAFDDQESADSSGPLDHDSQDGSATQESCSRNDTRQRQVIALSDNHDLQGKQDPGHQALDAGAKQTTILTIEEDCYNWFMNYNLHNCDDLVEFGATLVPELTYQDNCFSGLWSPRAM